MRETSVQLGERVLNCAVSKNDAAPFLMLHGVTRRWQTFLPLWSSLANRWQLSAFDFRGHGKSERATGGDYRVCDYVEDVCHYVQSQFERPIVLYGHSLGAMVAAAVAASCGSRVAAVILEDPPLHTMGERIEQTPLHSFFTIMRDLLRDSRSVAELAHMLADSMILNPSDGSRTRLGDLRDAASLRFTASCLSRLDPRVLDPIISGQWLAGFDIESIFSRVPCPCLLVQADPGAGGMLTDTDADSVESLLSDCVRINFSGCGHLVHWSRTAELLNGVHGFVESL